MILEKYSTIVDSTAKEPLSIFVDNSKSLLLQLEQKKGIRLKVQGYRDQFSPGKKLHQNFPFFLIILVENCHHQSLFLKALKLQQKISKRFKHGNRKVQWSEKGRMTFAQESKN